MTAAWWWRVGRVVAGHPSLWGTALVLALRLAVPGWWRRWPFLPRPDAAYLRFRMVTAYGDAEHLPEPDDVLAYLHWCRSWPRVVG